MGGSAELTNVGYSSLPSRSQSLSKAIYSVIGYSKPSRASSYSTSSSVVSSASGISGYSGLSRVSKVSKSSLLSRSSSLSRSISSAISSPTSYGSSTSTISKPPRIPRFRTPPLISGLSGKIKTKLKKKKQIELFGLFPDFTTRSIGLSPQKFSSVEQAVREIKRIKTPFEIQTGGTFTRKFKMPRGVRTEVRGSNVKKVGDMDINLAGIMK